MDGDSGFSVSGLWDSFTKAVGGLWDTVTGSNSTPAPAPASSDVPGQSYGTDGYPTTSSNIPFSLDKPFTLADISTAVNPSSSGLINGNVSVGRDPGLIDHSPVQNTSTDAARVREAETPHSLESFLGKNGPAILLLGGMQLLGNSANLNQQKKIADTQLAQNQQKINLDAQQQKFIQQNAGVPVINAAPVTPGTSPFLPANGGYNPTKVNTGIIGSGMTS